MADWPGPSERSDENLLTMTRAMMRCVDRWPHRREFYVAQADQFFAECQRRGLDPFSPGGEG